MENSNYIYVIKQLELGLRPLFFDACDQAGITGSQYTALTVLQLHPGVTSSELARRSFVRAQTMAVTLDPLIEAGYIRRESNALNGRSIQLFLTKAGQSLISEIAPRIHEIENLLVSELSVQEQKQFNEMLRKCRKSLDKSREESSEE